jgi:hypothetical protein
MRLWLAFKVFIKALSDPTKAAFFLEEQGPELQGADQSHLRMLALLQQSGRLIDFLKEDISAFSDAQVGAAARKIHGDCARCLEELVTIRPVMEESEGALVKVVAGYDAAQMKIVGKVQHAPPMSGFIVHRGWKAHKRSLPKKVGEQQSEVLCPAEIEVR